MNAIILRKFVKERVLVMGHLHYRYSPCLQLVRPNTTHAFPSLYLLCLDRVANL